MSTLRVPAQLRDKSGGQRDLVVTGVDFGAVLTNLQEEYPELAASVVGADGSLHRFLNVYVDDDDVRYLGLFNAPVSEDSVITLLPAVAGG